MSGILDDLVYALRQVRRQPGLALVIVFTLGGAMGVNTTLFSVVNTMWFKPWAVSVPDGVVVVRPIVSTAEWRHWAEQSRSFSGLVARRWGPMNSRMRSRQAFYEFVSSRYFGVLGVAIVMGRGFSADDEGSDVGGTSAVISHRTWQTQLGGDPGIVGRSISVNDVTFTVIGVAAPGFEGGDRFRRHLWLPLAAWPRLQSPAQRFDKSSDQVQAFGRLAPGVSALQAQAELQTLSRRFRSERGIALVPISLRSTDAYSQSTPSAQAQATLYTLLLAVTFLTLVACANVANLLLARGYARRREIAVRLSLGATRARLVRRLLVEAFLLALGAGLVGVAVSTVLPGHLFASLPSIAERMLLDFRPDHRVFAWALAASALACVVFGLAPALQCTRMSVSHVLKDAHGLSTPALKTSLPSMQALVSVMALGIAGMVVRSEPYAQARAFARSLDGIVLVRPEFSRRDDPARLRVLGTAIFDGLGELSGRHAVAAANVAPGLGEPGESRTLAVSPSYFAVLEVPIVTGRTFRATDAADRVLIVNETLASRRWPGENPLGKTLDAATSPDLARREVIGVVRDTSSSFDAGELVSYVPLSADAMRVFVVRDSEERAKRAVPPLLAALDPALRAEVVSGTTWLAHSSQGSGFIVRLVGEFGAFTLALATLGLFSLSEYTVRQRTREIGIRAALGARAGHVLAAVLRPASRALVNGLLAGSVGAACTGFVMRRFNLPAGVHPLDVANYAGVALVLALAGLLAAYRPARRALRIQPGEALRYE